MKKCIALILALACVLSVAGCAPAQVNNGQSGQSPFLLAAASYPEMAPYPNEMEYVDKKTGEFDDEAFSVVYDAWRESQNTQRRQPDGYADGLDAFFVQSIRQFLSRTNGQNRAYSPLNVYMALGMLAELTDGNSRQQILDLLDAADIGALRSQAAALWNANYCDDGAVTSVLASSLWLDEDVTFVQESMDKLAETYYASAYQGEMGSDAFNKALQSWLNEQTGGLLEEQASSIEMDPETILALATTIYFKAKWHNEFSEGKTAEGLFHLLSADGESVACDFMHQSGSRNYYWGDKFSSVAQPFEGGGAMWFILPDENVSMDELLTDGQAMDFLLANGDWDNSKHLIVNLSVPRFDVVSDVDLIDGLKAMGVTDVFDMDASDFSPMTTDRDDIYVSQASHAARVRIDEEGCEAAAYTVMMSAGAGMPPDEEVDFILDRPFLFVITGFDGLPLFVGVVNNPA